MEQQSLDDKASVYNMVYWIFEVYCSGKKKISFKILLLIDSAPNPQRGVTEM